MKELLEYINGFEPAFSRQVQGATATEVSRLESLVKRPLPTHYKDFLLGMGRGMGSLREEDTDFGIGRVLKFYETSKRRPPPRFIFIGAQLVDTYGRFLLDCGQAAEQADCPVVQADPEEPFENEDHIVPLYGSLKDMLFLLAFSRKRMALLEHRRRFLPSLVGSGTGNVRIVDPALVGAIDKTLLQLGFQKLPHTSPLTPLYERGDAAFYVDRSSQGGGISAELAARDEREFGRLVEVIQDSTTLV
ncbi:SMI1/KNR4 family protein [Corallococcus macrosporus]|uniref:Knr4/Smi1-like domain-containing protein n=2 Tax=Myxococcaceae TaxID=31 RepID=A0A250K422_9BACT|nr:SMI1/KNR4 family protein [Corallococcus macrosporus]AEI64597.1 hypothetical protein LILAB_13460 [Corallococcus macrosporus]ATB50650.1 hypothetical protein MYMAC_006306 [Corallococcus macrosporus DSM 14697]